MAGQGALGIRPEGEPQPSAFRDVSEAGALTPAHASESIAVAGFEAPAEPARRRRRVMACQWEDLGVMVLGDEDVATTMAAPAQLPSAVSGWRMAEKGDAPAQVWEPNPPPPPFAMTCGERLA